MIPTRGYTTGIWVARVSIVLLPLGLARDVFDPGWRPWWWASIAGAAWLSACVAHRYWTLLRADARRRNRRVERTVVIRGYRRGLRFMDLIDTGPKVLPVTNSLERLALHSHLGHQAWEAGFVQAQRILGVQGSLLDDPQQRCDPLEVRMNALGRWRRRATYPDAPEGDPTVRAMLAELKETP